MAIKGIVQYNTIVDFSPTFHYSTIHTWWCRFRDNKRNLFGISFLSCFFCTVCSIAKEAAILIFSINNFGVSFCFFLFLLYPINILRGSHIFLPIRPHSTCKLVESRLRIPPSSDSEFIMLTYQSRIIYRLPDLQPSVHRGVSSTLASKTSSTHHPWLKLKSIYRMVTHHMARAWNGSTE